MYVYPLSSGTQAVVSGPASICALLQLFAATIYALLLLVCYAHSLGICVHVCTRAALSSCTTLCVTTNCTIGGVSHRCYADVVLDDAPSGVFACLVATHVSFVAHLHILWGSMQCMRLVHTTCTCQSGITQNWRVFGVGGVGGTGRMGAQAQTRLLDCLSMCSNTFHISCNKHHISTTSVETTTFNQVPLATCATNTL